MTTPLNIQLIPGEHGGASMYEFIDSESVLVYGGNLDEMTEYFRKRLAEIIVSTEDAKKLEYKIEPSRRLSPVRKIAIEDLAGA